VKWGKEVISTGARGYEENEKSEKEEGKGLGAGAKLTFFFNVC
jgi:hypothetical protein